MREGFYILFITSNNAIEHLKGLQISDLSVAAYLAQCG
jgi:hypothetical protein